MTDVLIFVPGVMGSELWDQKGMLWPGNLLDTIRGYPAEKFQRLLAPHLEARDILRTAVGVMSVYQPWISAFSALRDRETGQPLFIEGGESPTLISVPYDWRRPIEEAAKVLSNAVSKAQRLHGASHLNPKFGSLLSGRSV